jgi:hypothetical protein
LPIFPLIGDLLLDRRHGSGLRGSTTWGAWTSPAGTRLALRSFDGVAWSELSVMTLKDPIPRGSVVTGSILVATSDLGSRIVLEALGTGEECDPINDRSAEILR